MKKLYSWIIGMVLISGCATNVKTSDIDPIMSNYKTYAFLPPGDKLNQGIDTLAFVEVRNQAAVELDQLGYTLNRDNPDFLVLIHANMNTDTVAEVLPESYTYYGPEFYDGQFFSPYYYPDFALITEIDPYPAVRLARYTYGTVVIDIIDTKIKKIVWRGSAVESDYGYNPDDIVEDAKENVDEIFDWFPKESDRG